MTLNSMCHFRIRLGNKWQSNNSKDGINTKCEYSWARKHDTNTFIGITLHTNTFIGISLHTNTFIGINLYTNTLIGISLKTNTFIGIALYTNIFIGISLHQNTFVGITLLFRSLDGANGWIRWATNNTQSQTPHPHMHNTQREPQHSHNQHIIMSNPGTKPAVFMPRKHKNNKRTHVLTHTHTTRDHV